MSVGFFKKIFTLSIGLLAMALSGLAAAGLVTAPASSDFTGAFENANWTPVTQTFGCGSSTVQATSTTVTLATALSCGAIVARYQHTSGAPVDGTVSLDWEVTETLGHAYQASIGVVGGEGTIVASSEPGSGSLSFTVAAGDVITLEVLKTSGVGVSSLIVSGFSFTPTEIGFTGEFADANWTPVTQTFGCGSSSVERSTSVVSLSTVAGCGAIVARYVHDNGGAGVSRAGTVSLAYEVTQTFGHAYTAEVLISGRQVSVLTEGEPAIGRLSFTVEPGDTVVLEMRKSSGGGVSTLNVSDFVFTPAQGFAGAYSPAEWTPTTQTFGCGSSTANLAGTTFSLATAENCGAIVARATHSNNNIGAPTAGTVSFSWEVTQSAVHGYEAQAGIVGQGLVSLTQSAAGSGRSSFTVAAGDQLQFQIDKSSGNGISTLNITDFQFTPAVAGFTDEFSPDNWTPLTQTFGCGASSVDATDAEFSLATASGCGSILARTTHTAAAPSAGIVAFSYEVTESLSHDYLAIVGVSGGQTTELTDSQPRSGRIAFAVERGDELLFQVSKSNGDGTTTLTVRDFSFTPQTTAFVAEFDNSAWTATTQTFGCGASTVEESPSSVTLSTSSGCGAILARLTHDVGAPAAATVSFAYTVRETGSHDHLATVEVVGRQSTVLAQNQAASGRMSFAMEAGEQLRFQVSKSSGSVQSALEITGFTFSSAKRDVVFSDRFEGSVPATGSSPPR